MQAIWFCLAVFAIAGYIVLDGFDLGAGIVQLFVARDEHDTAVLIRSVGPVWDGNEVWLVAAGGELLFAFPRLYASAFSGFYLSLMIVLWLLILRGISIELRDHVDNPLWRGFWGTVFGIASGVLALVFGIALGNVVRGVPLDQSGYFFLALWTDFSATGQAGIVDWYTLLIGAASFTALAMHGGLWVVLKTGSFLQQRTRSFAARCWAGSLVMTLLISVASFWIQSNIIRQFRKEPWGLAFPLLALSGLVWVRTLSRRNRDGQAFLASSIYLTGMLASAAFAIFPNVLPSNGAADLSLTIYNAAAGRHGLIVGLWWFIPGMALAFAYSLLVYRHFSGKVSQT
jgi:cytochrome d ubiquinol oxidase subunit II